MKRVESERKAKERGRKARRQARALAGSPPPGHAMTPKPLRPPKHKKKIAETDD